MLVFKEEIMSFQVIVNILWGMKCSKILLKTEDIEMGFVVERIGFTALPINKNNIS